MRWVEAFHIIFMVTWFAGLFYLPRLFVYHADVQDEAGTERFKVMERKLYAIMTIGALLTVFFGLWLLVGWHLWSLTHTLWLPLKLVLVALLIGYHWYCGRLVRAFREDRNRHSHVYYRWFNEFPSLILIAVVILVVVKPF
ncbi:MAG TPA: CopD family protein [Gammaproteobacteria bacterium]|nr:CopD family protein [Gammaproteobacteria bacterium]